jgi:hypothetical protein
MRKREWPLGFPAGDDAFDATVGLFGMLEVLLRRRTAGDPNEGNIRKLEGWILGGGVVRSRK